MNALEHETEEQKDLSQSDDKESFEYHQDLEPDTENNDQQYNKGYTNNQQNTDKTASQQQNATNQQPGAKDYAGQQQNAANQQTGPKDYAGQRQNAEAPKNDGTQIKELFNEKKNKEIQIFIQTMNFVKNNSGVVFGDHANMDTLEIGKNEKNDEHPGQTINFSGKSSIFESEETLMEWMGTHYNDFEMAFLVTLAVFERTPYLWVYEMAEELFGLFPLEEEEREAKQKEKEKMPSKQRILAAGAGLYHSFLYNHMGAVTCEFIRFVEPGYTHMVLNCVWKEFLFFRKILVDWLKTYIFCENYSKIQKAVNALAHLATFDYYYFDQHIIRNFLGEKKIETDFAAAQILTYTYEDEQYQKNIALQLKHWATLGNLHYSLTSLMVCSMGNWNQEQVEVIVNAYFRQVTAELQAGIPGAFFSNLSAFYEIGERRSAYFKSIVSALYEKFSHCTQRKHQPLKECIITIFLVLLWIDYGKSHIDMVNEKRNRDMIFVKMTFIKNEERQKLLALWNYVWKNRGTRKESKNLLELYIYQYGGCSLKQAQYLKQFLYSFLDTTEDRTEMDFFLQRIAFKQKRPVKPAQRVHYQLDQKPQKGR